MIPRIIFFLQFSTLIYLFTVDDWYGIICINGRINRLNSSNVGVTGTLYDFPFSSLRFLDYVDLSINQLFGHISHELGKLTNLVHLNLSNNQISGDLTRLKILYLDSNQLSGPIPGELGNLKNLTDLALSMSRPEPGLAVMSILNHGGLKHPYLSSNHALIHMIKVMRKKHNYSETWS
ncbi:hypothetical protein BC332_20358 [Capsicum chinense]|nr:hypothetical protein BC332_20358 [Capsicum chinense]